MAITFDALKKLLEAEKLMYFIHPQQPTAMLGFQGRNAHHRVTVSIQGDGNFLQYRILGFATCPLNSPHMPALLKLLAALNYQLRWVKFSLDPRDGEVAVTGDMWVCDATVTQQQVSRMFGNLLPCIDDALPRVQQVIQTGVDPGGKPAAAQPPVPAGPIKSL